MKNNIRIKIVNSPDLEEWNLSLLTGRTGNISEDLTGNERTVKGFMVWLDEPYEEENNWFIPERSIKASV